jgi:hypothetical protein
MWGSLKDEQLKGILWEAICRPGGVPEVLLLLREIALEMAEDQREVVQNERKAKIWKDLASALSQAANKSLGVYPVEG